MRTQNFYNIAQLKLNNTIKGSTHSKQPRPQKPTPANSQQPEPKTTSLPQLHKDLEIASSLHGAAFQLPKLHCQEVAFMSSINSFLSIAIIKDCIVSSHPQQP
jgi:hypothetical protein